MKRRDFLKGLGGIGVGVTVTSLAMPTAMAQAGSRSLVCVFLAGGADSFNLIVPRDHSVAGQSHTVYAATRRHFALPASRLLGIGDGAFGLHPNLTSMASLANDGKLAALMNVGPLARPTSRADYLAGRSLPQSLFAHDAQQKLWQSGRPTLTADFGWGGSIADAMAGGAAASPSFSLAGSNVWQNAPANPPSRLSPTVAIARLQGYDASLRSWVPTSTPLQALMEDNLRLSNASTNELEHAVAVALRRSVVTTEMLQEATADNEANDVAMTDVSSSPLGGQLLQVARLIKNRESLGMPRQVFFVRMGGWDTHGFQADRFPDLTAELDAALGSFHRSLEGMGVGNSVTTFTASDFGRTLTINGHGTDHGWGGHAFVMGGAVRAGIYGTFPSYSTTNNPDDATDEGSNFGGRIIPTTSVSQYGATLARWMGLTEPELANAFPEVASFPTSNLGFL